MRIFIGLTEVSGYYSNLKKGFDQLGVACTYVSLYAHPFDYGETAGQGFLPSLARLCVRKRIEALAGASRIARGFWLCAVLLTRILVFGWAIARFDVFILGGGSSFFRFRELPLLKLLGKRVVYMFHGTDSRPGYMDGFCEDVPRISPRTFEDLLEASGSDARAAAEVAARLDGYTRATRRRRVNVERVEPYADVAINHTAHGHFHTGRFVPSVIIGLPYQFEAPPAPATPRAGTGVRILHSPSQPEGKGTFHIRAAIEQLVREGLDLDYVEITGRPNAEVLRELQQSDFVVDQAYSDYPMAAFAMEAAFFGKPAVVGGYYAHRIHLDIPEQYIPPTLFCLPQDMAEAIRRLATDPGYRQDLGERARKFVTGQWNAREVASRYLRLIRGDIPGDWLFDPGAISYVEGIGQPEPRTRAIVRALIEQRGESALQLDRRPGLKKLFIDFAYGRRPSAAKPAAGA